MPSEFESRVEEVVINAETNPYRFERFCNAVVSHAEGGAPIVGTSLTWDLGRDGYGVGVATGIFVCTSLRDDADAKALSDLARLERFPRKISRLYFCSSQSLTEHRIESLQQQLLEEVDRRFPVTVLGSIQLADLGRDEGKTLNSCYGAEIKNVVSLINAGPGDDVELQGLRLALMSSGADESAKIRDALYSSAILDALADGNAKTKVAIANHISAGLRLSRSLDAATLGIHLEGLTSANLIIAISGGLYQLTQEGRAEIAQRQLEGAQSLVSGRNKIREELERSIGAPIIDDEFARIWAVFEEKMAEYFQHRGETIVAEVDRFVNGVSAASLNDDSAGLSFLDEFASAVSITARHEERQTELKQAIKDIFIDRQGEATAWLVRICAGFVAACAMGLEYQSSEAIRRLIQKTQLALDTDAVLTLICECEPDHDAISEVVKKWADVGGRVIVGAPVLEEAAYHAFIAERDYQQVSHLIPGTPESRAHLIENAFVRAFALLVATGEARANLWPKYIAQFKGANEYDYSNLFAYLSAEHRIGLLPEREASDAVLVEQVKKYLLEIMEKQALRIDKNMRDKAGRDSELYVGLVNHARRVRVTDSGAACLLVSSARLLALVDKRFSRSAEDHFVVSIGAVAYVSAMLPNVSLGLSAMKSFLFDETRIQRFSSDLERSILRVIATSGDRSLPFAKRGILMREVRGRLLTSAGRRGDGTRESLKDVEARAITADGREGLVLAIAESLDAISVDPKAAKENRELRAQIRSLQLQIEQLKKK